MARSRENVKVGGLRSRLGVEMLEDRVNPTSPVGYLDFAGAIDYTNQTGYNYASSAFRASGWAVDPDVLTTPIQVHIYVNGSIAAIVNTGDYRSDLGQYWGYHWDVPSQYLPTSGVFAIDAFGIDSTGTSWTHLNSTKFYNGKPGDMAVSNPYAVGGPITVHASGSLAGAIDAIYWNGGQFIDNYDHGRLVQTAFFAGTHNRSDLNVYRDNLFNPTEGGRQRDPYPNYGVAPSQNPSTSQLTRVNLINPAAMQTTTNMANWLTWGGPGDPYDFNNGYGGWQGIDGVSSGAQVTKTVVAGYNGHNNIIQVYTDVTVPNIDGGIEQLKIFSPIVYTNPNLVSSLGYYDPINNTTPDITHNNPRGSVEYYSAVGDDPSEPPPVPLGNFRIVNNYVPIMVGSYGAYAIALVSRQLNGPYQLAGDNRYDLPSVTRFQAPQGISGGLHPKGDIQGYNASPGGGGSPGIMSRDFEGQVGTGYSLAGTYTFESFIVVGSLETVKSELSYLYSQHKMD